MPSVIYNRYPQYEFFTGVEVVFSVDGDRAKSFIVSKIGEYFQSLTIKEGTLTGNGQQLVSPSGGGVASGTLTLLDEDNSIFLSLLSSKSSNGNALLNELDITLHTYTGDRRYDKCRVSKWSTSFGSGVPQITLEWTYFPSSSSPSTTDRNQSALVLDSNQVPKLKSSLFEKGVRNFEDFARAISEGFTDKFTFYYSSGKEYTAGSLQSIGSDGRMTVFRDSNDSGSTGYIYFPDEVMEDRASSGGSSSEKVFRFSDTGTGSLNDRWSYLKCVMDKFCATVCISLQLNTKSDSKLKLGWQLIDGNKILLFSYLSFNQLTVPSQQGTSAILQNSVFLYNSSAMQGSVYSTPSGDKIAYVVDSLSTSYSMDNFIVAFTNSQSNSANPNGNMILTSRGTLTLPDKMPQYLKDSVQKLSAVTMAESFRVRITVYNFIHFYCLGQESAVNLIVFDHMGRVHPITGQMRVMGYSYSLDKGGVIKADVDLGPMFTRNAEDFTTTLTNPTNPSSPSNTTTQGYSDESDQSSTDSVSTDTTQPGAYVAPTVPSTSEVDYTIGEN